MYGFFYIYCTWQSTELGIKSIHSSQDEVVRGFRLWILFEHLSQFGLVDRQLARVLVSDGSRLTDQAQVRSFSAKFANCCFANRTLLKKVNVWNLDKSSFRTLWNRLVTKCLVFRH